MDYTISLQSLFWLAGGLAALIGLFAIFRKPFDQLDDHERRLKDLEENREERKKTDKLILRSFFAIINNMIDGSGNLTEIRDELQRETIDSHK